MRSASAFRPVVKRICHCDAERHGCRPAEQESAGVHPPRERDVLALLAQGDTNAGIAAFLAMRESTVKAHVSRILTALEVTNRVQAALVARDAGLTT